MTLHVLCIVCNWAFLAKNITLKATSKKFPDNLTELVKPSALPPKPFQQVSAEFKNFLL